MTDELTPLSPIDDHQAALQATLARLNEIGAAVNSLESGDLANVNATLEMIVESAVDVLPGASAVLYGYDDSIAAFDPGSRVSAEAEVGATTNDFPRPHGIGTRAIRQKRRVVSYEESDIDIHPEKVAGGARVMCCYPLIVAGEVLGALYVYLKDKREFLEIELLLDNFVNLGAMALFLARQLVSAEDQRRRKDRELRRLHRAGLLLSSPASVPETLEAILQMALEVIDAQYGIFRLVDAETESLVTHAFVGKGLEDPGLEPLSLNSPSIMGLAASRREPVLISDLRHQDYQNIYVPLDSNVEMRSEVVVPLLGSSNRLEGVLNLESPQVNAFSEQDLYLLQILATQAVFAIQRSRLLRALQEISSLITTDPGHEVLDFIAAQACDLLNVPVSQIWVPDGGDLKLQAASPGQPVGLILDINNSLIGSAILTNEMAAAVDFAQDSRVGQTERDQHPGAGSALAVPIVKSEIQQPLGAISIFTNIIDHREFGESDWETKVLTILGHYVELALRHENQQETLRLSREQQAVAETFAALGDVSANLLHQLNNRMGTIPVRVQGIMEKCRAEVLGNPYLNNNLLEIENSAQAAMKSVRDSLVHLRPIQLSAVEVAPCVEHAIQSAEIPEKIRLKMHGLKGLPKVRASEQGLRLAIQNLIENAIAALEGEGEIEIYGSAGEETVLVSVTDSGPGIPPDLRAQIFEFNFSGAGAENPDKLGFGLWWVKTMLTRFGGRVSVESDGESWTQFVLHSPRSESGS